MDNRAYYRLYERFYKDGKALLDRSASGHWRECARHFKITDCGRDDLQAVGYGFGSSDSIRYSDRLFALAGNGIRMAGLKVPGLTKRVRDAKTVVRRMGLWFSQDAFRQVCTLTLIEKQLAPMATPKRILIIGDGPGILSALLHASYPSAEIFLIDLGSVLFFQAYNHHRGFPDERKAITDESTIRDGFIAFNYCPADRLSTLPNCDFDLAVNVASMQEMDKAVTADYFALMRRHNTKLFYCCNRLEKHLVGGEISRFMDYPWSPADEHLIDEPCPWHQWYFGIGRSPNVTFLSLPVPLMHRYDGLHWHRFTRLERKSCDA